MFGVGTGRVQGRGQRALRIPPRPLRNRLHHANSKLRAKNRLEAVMHALRRALS